MSAQYRYRKCGGYGFARAWVIFFFTFVCFFCCHFSRFHFSTIFRTHYALVDIICFWCSYFTLYCALMESEEEWRKRNVMHERSWIWAESTRREKKQFGRAHSTQRNYWWWWVLRTRRTSERTPNDIFSFPRSTSIFDMVCLIQFQLYTNSFGQWVMISLACPPSTSSRRCRCRWRRCQKSTDTERKSKQ